jgi:hypothetical protein
MKKHMNRYVAEQNHDWPRTRPLATQVPTETNNESLRCKVEDSCTVDEPTNNCPRSTLREDRTKYA